MTPKIILWFHMHRHMYAYVYKYMGEEKSYDPSSEEEEMGDSLGLLFKQSS